MNWNKVTDLRPPSENDILFVTKNGKTFFGYAYYFESWYVDPNDPENKLDYKKYLHFSPYVQMKERECCEGNTEPLAVEFSERCYLFKESEVEYWAEVRKQNE